MNRIPAVCFGVLLVAAPAWAEFKMPKNVYRMDQFDKAKAEAESKGRAITVIVSQEKTTCPLCAGASLGAADSLGRKTVVLYAEFQEMQKLPVEVQSALNQPAMGIYIPKTVVMDAALTNAIAIVPYSRGDEFNRRLKDALQKLASLPAKAKPAARPLAAAAASTIPAADNREARTWRPITGSPVEAALVQEQNGWVTLKDKRGAKMELPSTTLRKDDQAYLEKLRSPPIAKAEK